MALIAAVPVVLAALVLLVLVHAKGLPLHVALGRIGIHLPMLKVRPDQLAPFLQDARDAFGAARWRDAVTAYGRVLALEPNSLEALNERGVAHLNLGENLPGCRDLARAKLLVPKDPRERYYHANSAGALDRAARSDADLQAVTTLTPTDAYGYLLRARAWFDLNQSESTIKDCSEAIRLDPRYAAAFDWRGLARDGLRKYDAALQDLNEAIRLSPRVVSKISCDSQHISRLRKR